MAPFKLLETMRYEPSLGIVLQELHFERLGSAAKHFGFEMADASTTKIAKKYIPGAFSTSFVVRITVDNAGALVVEEKPLPAVTPLLRVCFAAQPLDAANEFLYHKTTNRSVYQQARQPFPNVDDVILWNEAGEICETTFGNIVVKLDGRYITPPNEAGLLPGTFRQKLLNDKIIVEQTISKQACEEATDLFFINSVRGWVKLTLV